MRRIKKFLPPLEEHERIYFDVPYNKNGLAKCTHCGYDPDKKLWFTGIHNNNLYGLVKAYGINKETTEIMRKQVDEVLEKFRNKKTPE